MCQTTRVCPSAHGRRRPRTAPCSPPHRILAFRKPFSQPNKPARSEISLSPRPCQGLCRCSVVSTGSSWSSLWGHLYFQGIPSSALAGRGCWWQRWPQEGPPAKTREHTWGAKACPWLLQNAFCAGMVPLKREKPAGFTLQSLMPFSHLCLPNKCCPRRVGSKWIPTHFKGGGIAVKIVVS